VSAPYPNKGEKAGLPSWILWDGSKPWQPMIIFVLGNKMGGNPSRVNYYNKMFTSRTFGTRPD